MCTRESNHALKATQTLKQKAWFHQTANIKKTGCVTIQKVIVELHSRIERLVEVFLHPVQDMDLCVTNEKLEV